VADRQRRLSVGCCRRDLDLAAVEVVPDGVVGQVLYQAVGQVRVTGGRGRVKRGVDADAPAVGFPAAVHYRLPGDLGEIERRPLVDAALAAGQREQGRDEPFLLVAQRQHLL